jgi:hypothetical protein
MLDDPNTVDPNVPPVTDTVAEPVENPVTDSAEEGTVVETPEVPGMPTAEERDFNTPGSVLEAPAVDEQPLEAPPEEESVA